MNSAIMTKGPASPRRVVMFANPLTPVVLCMVFRDCVARTWQGAYQSYIVMGKIQGKMSAANEVQDHGDNEKRLLGFRLAVWLIEL